MRTEQQPLDRDSFKRMVGKATFTGGNHNLRFLPGVTTEDAGLMSHNDTSSIRSEHKKMWQKESAESNSAPLKQFDISSERPARRASLQQTVVQPLVTQQPIIVSSVREELLL